MLARRLSLGGILMVAAYVVVDAFVPNTDMILATRLLAAAVSSVVLVCWFPEFMTAIRSPTIRPGHLAGCAVALGCMAVIVSSAYLVIWRLAGQPRWLANSDLTALILLFEVAAQALFVLEPSATTLQVPTRNRLATGIAIGIAAVMLLLLIGTRPDLGPMLERIRPFITDWFETGGMSAVSAAA